MSDPDTKSRGALIKRQVLIFGQEGMKGKSLKAKGKSKK